jgi:hypothetical protein
MPRSISIAAKPSQGRIDPNLVPDDVKQDIEDTMLALGTDGKRVAQITFEDKKELNGFVKQARTYCETRTVLTENPVKGQDPITVAAPLVFRRTPRKGAPDNLLTFTVSVPAAKDEQ